MALEFGVVVPTWGAFGDAQKIRQLIQRAEALGYASIWVGDHLLLFNYAYAPPPPADERVIPTFDEPR